MFKFPRSSSISKIQDESNPFLHYAGDLTTAPPKKFQGSEGYHSKVISYSAIVVVTSILWLLVFFAAFSKVNNFNDYISPTDYKNRHNITTNAQLIECGNSTQEAKSRGCQFDVLLNHWVPAPCIDNEFLEEYMDDESWGAYADEALTQRLSTIEEMYERDFYFTSLRDHINHCSMLWKKQFWVLYKQYSAFDTIIANPAHTDHCAYFLAESRDVNTTQSTRVEKGYAGCWIRK
ncbi:hypothetical protein GcM1_196030 [Golovinomyces cichoracearum]|uniref:Uncharacterized protein n=1 Tax=Golovinomyces cichoracearum TaxID=62708 RepID=A0A420J011_9PEZI|nr:hypothetical protein GcM1_196030 [Golovinomyces cichoracearum]